MLRTNRQIRLFLFFAAMAILLTACGTDGAEVKAGNKGGSAGRESKRPAPKPVPIAVAHVVIGEATSFYSTTASLEAEAHTEIRARTSGVVQTIFNEEGDQVDKDRVLLQLEDDTQKLDLKQAVLRRKALENQFERQKKMFASGVLSPQQFEETENAYNQSEAVVEQAELMLYYTKVRAPFEGRLVRRILDIGSHVQSGAVLFEMMDVSPLLARIHIPANRMGEVREGQELVLRLDSTGVELAGKLRLVSPIVDPNTGTVKVTAEIPIYPAGTRPGDFVAVNIVTARHDHALMVPSEAVFEEQGNPIVYVAADGKAVRRTVTVGFVEQGTTEILKGVESGDLIVVKGQRNLRPGMPVEIMEGPQSNVGADSSLEASL